MELDIFNYCGEINELINNNEESQARDEVIKLLDYCEQHNIVYTPLINHLIRSTGLYPYLNQETANWQDRFVYESFKVDTGDKEPKILHRAQSLLLKELLTGKNIAVSAPTSFGKSFVIDAFIAIKKPKNVMLIVPTLALTDETRRRIQKKFSNEYKIITTTETVLAEKNIFIFPQERAISYVKKIDSIDILIIDEFYKASEKFDKERSPTLLRVLLKLNKKVKQKYFLAPNITHLTETFFTKGVKFLSIDFNTVFLEKKELFNEINGNEIKKSNTLINILQGTKGKSLIYAGTFPSIETISKLVCENLLSVKNEKLESFCNWLENNYSKNWNLTNLIIRGTGVHNGQLPRSLSQIQIKLFEDSDGLQNIISTSSIIEGVNTSAENVILWSRKDGPKNLNDFSYKNIIGRGGRMFKHFIGKIFILEKPPEPEEENLQLSFSDNLLFEVDAKEHSRDLTVEQMAAIIAYKEEMSNLLTKEKYQKIQDEELIKTSNAKIIMNIAKAIKSEPEKWMSLKGLNSSNPEHWKSALYHVLGLNGLGIREKYSDVVNFILTITDQWNLTIPQLLSNLEQHNLTINDCFRLERTITNKLAQILNDVNIIQQAILPQIDISPFIFKISHAFLPPVVLQLEEYGLPRMISRKIYDARVIDFMREDIDIYSVITDLNNIGFENLSKHVKTLEVFDKYILEYFFDGISKN